MAQLLRGLTVRLCRLVISCRNLFCSRFHKRLRDQSENLRSMNSTPAGLNDVRPLHLIGQTGVGKTFIAQGFHACVCDKSVIDLAFSTT